MCPLQSGCSSDVESPWLPKTDSFRLHPRSTVAAKAAEPATVAEPIKKADPNPIIKLQSGFKRYEPRRHPLNFNSWEPIWGRE